MASGDSKDSRNNAPSYTPAAPWAKLRAWIDKHEAWEREHGEAANLHDKERAAVSTLVPLFTTPQMDETNYVGVLSNFISNRSIQVYYDDRSLSVWVNGAPKNMWQVFATVVDLNENNDLTREKFPRDDMNPKSGGDLIVFDNKKQAKQYAAMCVLRFLKPDVVPGPGQPSQMAPAPRDTAEQAAAAAATQSAKRQAGKALDLAPAIKKQCTESSGEAAPEPDRRMQEPVTLSDPTSTSMRRPSLTTTTPHSAAAVAEEAAMSLDGMLSSARISENGTSASSDQIQALELATSMGLGSPQYVVKPDDDNPGCFSGYASLQPGSRAPSRLAFVRNASSKAEATSKIAEELHGWLKKEWQRRVDLRSTFLKDIVAVGT